MVRVIERFVVKAPHDGQPSVFGGTVLETLSNGQVVESQLEIVPVEELSQWIPSLNAQLLVENQSLTAERDSLTRHLATMTTERDSASSQLEVANARIAELTAVAEPPVATLSQIRVWLLQTLGVNAIKQVDAMIAAIPDELERAIAYQQWEYANNVLRDNPFVLLIAQQLNLTSEQMDEAYLAATRIV